TVNAPVQPDGTFSIDGLPRGKLKFVTAAMQGAGQRYNVKRINVSQPTVENVQLEVKASSGTVNVLVRAMYGDELDLATVFILTGTYPAETTLDKVMTPQGNATSLFASRLTPDEDSPSVHIKSKKNDLFVAAENRPEGTATVCAMPLPKTLDTPGFEGP